MAKGRRKRARGRGGRAGDAGAGEAAGAGQVGGGGRSQRVKAPVTDYPDAQGGVLSLRGSLTAKARRQYADTLAGVGSRPADTPEDRLQRAVELLFERLAVRWEIAGVPLESQRELLQRYRFASADERSFVRRALREHCEERFPDVQVP